MTTDGHKITIVSLFPLLCVASLSLYLSAVFVPVLFVLTYARTKTTVSHNYVKKKSFGGFRFSLCHLKKHQ